MVSYPLQQISQFSICIPFPSLFLFSPYCRVRCRRGATDILDRGRTGGREGGRERGMERGIERGMKKMDGGRVASTW